MTTSQALAAFLEEARRVAAANDNTSSADSTEAGARSVIERSSGETNGSGDGPP